MTKIKAKENECERCGTDKGSRAKHAVGTRILLVCINCSGERDLNAWAIARRCETALDRRVKAFRKETGIATS